MAVQASTPRLHNARNLNPYAAPRQVPIPCQTWPKALLPAFLLISAPSSGSRVHTCSLLCPLVSLFPSPSPCMSPICLGLQLIMTARKLPACRLLFSLAISQLVDVQLVVCKSSRGAAHWWRLENRLASFFPFLETCLQLATQFREKEKS